MEIRITHYARLQIRLIFLYYKHAASITVAHKIRKDILTSLKQLEKFPESGQEEELLNRFGMNYRRIISGNYKIIYKIEQNVIVVTDVFDSRQYPSGISL